jgi:cytochrome P450
MAVAGGVPPGPRGFPVIGNLLQLRADPIRTFSAAADRYGDLVYLKAGGYHGYLLSDPAQIKHVLQDNYRNYHKSPLYARLKESLGEGLVTSEDSLWLRQRRLAQPAFHRERLGAMVATMNDAIDSTLEGWNAAAGEGRTIDLVEDMMDLTQRIIVRTMFSTELGHASVVVNRTWPIINQRIGETLWATPLETRLPLPANVRFRKAVRELDAVVYQIIRDRRRAGGDGPDLLSMFLSARDEETGERMSDRQLRDEVMTMLLAGHETTSLALSWTYFVLADHPDIADRIVNEAADVLDDATPTLTDIERLSYTRMVIQEVLRLYPPAWGFSRLALNEDHIGGYRVPAGSIVFLIPFVLHRRPELWPDPHRFDPERFTADRVAARPKFAYLPFGGGPRQCIGSQFAMTEASLILTRALRQYQVELVPNQCIEARPLITLRPHPTIKARVTRRVSR